MGIIKFAENHKENLKKWEITSDVRLQELGDKAFPITVENFDEDFISYSSVINGKLYEYGFTRFKEDTFYILEYFTHSKQFIEELMNKYNVPDEVTLYDSAFFLVEGGNRTTDITGTGDAPFVFATTKAAYEKFFLQVQEKFDILHFSAKEPSRQRLYDFFSSVLEKQKGWKVETFSGQVKDYFIINQGHFGVEDESEEGWLV
jgi:hypothetical protein